MNRSDATITCGPILAADKVLSVTPIHSPLMCINGRAVAGNFVIIFRYHDFDHGIRGVNFNEMGAIIVG